MGDFYSRKPVAMWRIVFYGFLTAACLTALGYYQNDHKLYYAAGIFGVFIVGFGFVLSWMRANVKPIQTEPGQPKRFPRWVYWMFYGGLSVSIALKLWDVLHKR
jgi:Ni/Fe-hydrogenase subunit HybB-like protein